MKVFHLNARNRFLIRPLTLSSGEQHPSASFDQFSVPSPPFDDVGSMKIEMTVADKEILVCAARVDELIGDYNDIELSDLLYFVYLVIEPRLDISRRIVSGPRNIQVDGKETDAMDINTEYLSGETS